VKAEEIKEMGLSEIQERISSISNELTKDLTNEQVDELNNEVDLLQAREKELKECEERERKRQAVIERAKEFGKPMVKENKASIESMEYRKAFMHYVQTGEKTNELIQRADVSGTSSDLGVLIPQTVVQKVIKDLDGVYGQLYSRVLKTNLKGGVKYPIGSFNATFNRIAENAVSERQKGGSITGYVEFSYLIGEIRIARSLLQVILSVEAFETELAKTIVQAYVKAMDVEIMNGDSANNQMEGILTEANKTSSRIKASHIIEFTSDEIASWKQWQTKLFAEIPLAMRGLGYEFVMTPQTYEANIKTLADDNNRPVYLETFNPIDGAEISRFKGHDVVFVEEDVLKSFDDAATGEYFGMVWVPQEAYAINSNLEFSVMRYFDQETNQYVSKAIVVNDGKILNPDYIYLLKKKVA